MMKRHALLKNLLAPSLYMHDGLFMQGTKALNVNWGALRKEVHPNAFLQMNQLVADTQSSKSSGLVAFFLK